MTEHLFDLAGRGAVVTGGGTHLGAAMARALATRGAQVCLIGRTETRLRRAAEEMRRQLGDAGPQVMWHVGDITDDDSIDTAVGAAHEAFGDLSIAVCNAGATGENVFPPDEPTEMFAATIESHLIGTFRTAQAAARRMPDGRGAIVTISSMQGSLASDPRLYEGLGMEFRSGPGYQAAKGGIINLTRNLAAELGGRGIRVNCISPGFIPKPGVAVEGFVERTRRGNALGIVGEADDLAGAVVLLASDAGRFITGHNLVVDGGWSIW